MNKFRKKPVEIEAIQFTPDNCAEIEAWSGGMFQGIGDNSSGYWKPKCGYVRTLEGTMTALFGDWIIRGVKGEFYPCKPDIFDETYDPVEAT